MFVKMQDVGSNIDLCSRYYLVVLLVSIMNKFLLLFLFQFYLRVKVLGESLIGLIQVMNLFYY